MHPIGFGAQAEAIGICHCIDAVADADHVFAGIQRGTEGNSLTEVCVFVVHVLVDEDAGARPVSIVKVSEVGSVCEAENPSVLQGELKGDPRGRRNFSAVYKGVRRGDRSRCFGKPIGAKGIPRLVNRAKNIVLSMNRISITERPVVDLFEKRPRIRSRTIVISIGSKLNRTGSLLYLHAADLAKGRDRYEGS